MRKVVICGPYRPISGAQRVIIGVAPEDPALLVEITELIESGALRTVIDRRYRLDQIVEAHEFVDTGHKAGNVVICFENADAASDEV